MELSFDTIPADAPPQSPRWVLPTEALGRVPAAADLVAVAEAEEVARYAYHIGDLGLLIGAGVLAELVLPPRPERLPGTPPWFLGIANLRGSLLPFFDLHLLFGVPSSASLRTRSGLVLGRGDEAVGLLVDSAPRTVRGLAALTERPPLPESLVPHVAALYMSDHAVYVDFEHAAFFRALGERLRD